MYKAGLLFLVLLLSGCYFDTRFETTAPDRITINPSAEFEESMILLPIRIESDEVQRLFQQTLDERIRNDQLYFERIPDAGDGVSLIFFLKHWKNVSLYARNNTIEVHIPLDAYLRADWERCKSVTFETGNERVCVEDHEDINTEFTVIAKINPTLSQAYLLEPNVHFDYSLDRASRIKVGPANINLLSKMRRVLSSKLLSFEEKLAALIKEKSNAKFYAQSAWNLAQQPIPVIESGNVWLLGDVITLNATQPFTDNNVAHLGVGLRGKFSIFNGKPGNALRLKPLPALRPVSSSSGFTLNVPVTVDYGELEAQLNERLQGHLVEHDGNQLRFNKLRVYGASDGRLVIGAKVFLKSWGDWFGRVGWIYLLGNPVYDSAASEVAVEAVEYDVITESTLSDVAAWALSPDVTDKIQHVIAFNVADEMSLAESNANEYMTEINNGGRLSGNLDSFSVGDIAIQRFTMQITARASGSMLMRLSDLFNAEANVKSRAEINDLCCATGAM